MIEGVTTRADGKSHLRLRVRAAPEDGKANAAVRQLLSQQLDIPASRVRVIGGEASRTKTIRLTGAAQSLAPALLALAAQSGK